MKYQDATEYLDSFINHEYYLHKPSSKKFSLINIRRLLETLGSPQEKLRIIHIAGSKGKGSVCAMTANILKHAGYKVGLYTSPHIYDVRERIRVLDESGSKNAENSLFSDQITEMQFSDLIEKHKPVLEKARRELTDKPLSYFEVLTALAFDYFCENKTDFVVLETGLGGRLDATNATEAMICAITPISLEHTKILGDTLEKIALEKAAIIKNKNQRVVISEQKKEARDVIVGRCKEFQIKPVIIGEDIQYKILSQGLDQQIINVYSGDEYANISLAFLGDHQAGNAATAIGIIESIKKQKFEISNESVYKGLKDAFWPGRMEVLRKEIVMVFDSAHNKSSAQFLAEYLRAMFPKGKITVVLGILSDKDRRGICEEISSVVDKIVATRPQHPRAYRFKDGELESTFSGKECFYTDNVKEAVDLACQKMPKDGVMVVMGSIYTVGEARKLCIN